jgi:hypothetical protein
MDKLTLIIKKHLDSKTKEHKSKEDVIFDSVAEYIHILMGEGNIPQHMLLEIEEDLMAEADVIYKKITYGSLSLEDYKKRRSS